MSPKSTFSPPKSSSPPNAPPPAPPVSICLRIVYYFEPNLCSLFLDGSTTSSSTEWKSIKWHEKQCHESTNDGRFTEGDRNR